MGGKTSLGRALPRTLGIALIALLASVFTTPAHGAARPEPPGAAELEALFDELLPAQLERGRIPGAAVAVVRDGELLLAKGYGYADLEARRPVDPERTLFRTGSAGKPVTWTAVMQLVEQGRLDLHADVSAYLDFSLPATFAEPITLAHLLTHTPGFEDVGEGLFVLTPEAAPPLGDYLRARLPARLYPPGAVQAYSNYGTALAAYIVERAAGEPFEAHVERHIFAPLGMERSTLRQPPPADLAADLAGGYSATDAGFARGGFVYAGPAPAGGMSATATDMARFMLAHLGGGEAQVLRPETLEQMQRRQLAPDPRLDGVGYGWMERTTNGRRALYHRGSILHFNAGLYLLPEERSGLYVVYNAAGGAAATDELWRAFMDRAHPAPAPAPLAPPEGAAERAAQYAGEYHLARAEQSGGGKVLRLLDAAHVGATPDGELTLMVEGRAEPYVELEPGLYRHRDREERLAFFAGADGRQWLALDGSPAFDTLTATSAFRAPWYATAPVAALATLGALALFALSGAGWLIGALRRRGGRGPRPPLARLARPAAAAFGLLLLGFAVAFVAALADSDPAYGMPRIFFGPTPLLQVVLLLPPLLAAAGAAMLACAAAGWLGLGGGGRPYWGVAGRLHYAALTLAAGAALWALWHWNLLSPPW